MNMFFLAFAVGCLACVPLLLTLARLARLARHALIAKLRNTWLLSRVPSSYWDWVDGFQEAADFDEWAIDLDEGDWQAVEVAQLPATATHVGQCELTRIPEGWQAELTLLSRHSLINTVRRALHRERTCIHVLPEINDPTQAGLVASRLLVGHINNGGH